MQCEVNYLCSIYFTAVHHKRDESFVEKFVNIVRRLMTLWLCLLVKLFHDWTRETP